jgi:hypothetical protein
VLTREVAGLFIMAGAIATTAALIGAVVNVAVGSLVAILVDEGSDVADLVMAFNVAGSLTGGLRGEVTGLLSVAGAMVTTVSLIGAVGDEAVGSLVAGPDTGPNVAVPRGRLWVASTGTGVC